MFPILFFRISRLYCSVFIDKTEEKCYYLNIEYIVKEVTFMTWAIFFLITALLIGTELLLAWKRPLILQGIRAASHILSAVAAFFITKACSAPLAKAFANLPFIAELGKNDIENAQIKELVSNSSPIASAIVSPAAFLLIWILTGIVFYIIYKIIAVALTKKMNLRERPVQPGSRAASMAVGGFMAILISFTVWMPVSGYVMTADNMADAVVADIESGKYDISEDTVQAAKKVHRFVSAESSSFRFINSITNFAFRGLTSYKICGEKDNVYHDFPIAADAFLDTFKPLKDLLSEIAQDVNKSIDNLSFEAFSDEDIQKLRDIAGELNRSLAYKSSVAYILLGMSEAVHNDNDYITIKLLLDTSGEYSEQKVKINDFIRTIAKAFAETKPDTVCADLNRFADIIRDVRDTADVVTLISGKEIDFYQTDVRAIFENINPDSSEAVADAIAILAEAVPESHRNIRGSTMLISDVYRIMGQAKSDSSVSDKEYKKETDSIVNIVSIATEDDRDEQEMLKIYADSKVMPTAAKDAVARGDEAIFGISDDYMKTLEEEFAKYISENGSSDEISALAQLFGVKLD